MNESDSMATRPAPTKKAPAQTVPGKKPPAKKTVVPAAKTKAVAAPVVTLKTVFEELGMSYELSKKQAHGLLADVVTAVTTHLKKGARIRMSGLGTLEVKKRAARMGRNPATGESIRIKASKKVAFRVAKELKETV
jgi:DNA-binding protein HU-beta